MNKILSAGIAGFIAMALFICGAPMGASAAQGKAQPPVITVLVDGKAVKFEQEPVIIRDRVMVSVGEIAEAMGWDVRADKGGINLSKHGVMEVLPGKVYFTKYSSQIDLIDDEGLRLYHYDTVGGIYMWHLLNGHYPQQDNEGCPDRSHCHEIAQTPLTATPVVINGKTFVALKDLTAAMYAKSTWDGVTKTVKVTSGKLPFYDGAGLPSDYRDGLLKRMMAVYNVTNAAGIINAPSAPPSPAPELGFTPSGVMTTAPEVGSVPANIMLPGKTDVKNADSFYAQYKPHFAHGCNWYGFDRFYETYGYQIPVGLSVMPIAYMNLVDRINPESIRTERSTANIISGCMALYSSKDGSTRHIVFVEYVERDVNGNPTEVYYTECRNSNSSGLFIPESDGKVIKVTFERFKKSGSQLYDLIGYIVPGK
ncbi:hypothetical protein FACS18945_4340 [Bacteroidia bacterium]|nr:hypothetical protein FACS18945_4340 [Bacteroidia bacterium]